MVGSAETHRYRNRWGMGQGHARSTTSAHGPARPHDQLLGLAVAGWCGRPAGTGGHTGAPTGPRRRLYDPGWPRESGPPVGEEAIRRAAGSLVAELRRERRSPGTAPPGDRRIRGVPDPPAGHSSQPDATKTGSGAAAGPNARWSPGSGGKAHQGTVLP
jgi:hypothetical protein